MSSVFYRKDSSKQSTVGFKPDKSLKRSRRLQTCEMPAPAFGEYNSSSFIDIPLTRQSFLESYSQGKWNLSVVSAPPCFKEGSLLKAPVCYEEGKRLVTVDSYVSSLEWNDTEFFQKIINKISKIFKCSGASISLITDRHQIVKYDKALGFKEFPRQLSIDAHTILSSDFFILLNASTDWRFIKNPLVKSVPFIKFYAAAPLVAKNGQVIGAVSAFDVFPRADFTKQNVQILKGFSTLIMNRLDSPSSGKELKDANKPLNAGKQFMANKDGSGSAYSPNQHFRLNNQSYEEDNKDILELRKAMISCNNARTAASFLCRKVHQSQGFNFVYVMEIRIIEPFKIASELLPLENRIDAEKFAHMTSLIKNGDENVKTRLLGSYGLNSESMRFEPLIHCRAFTSDFGIKYSSQESGIRFKSGACLPILKSRIKIVRRRPITLSKKLTPQTEVEVYVKSGGFLIAGFNEGVCYTSESSIDAIVQSASVFRQLYLTGA